VKRAAMRGTFTADGLRHTALLCSVWAIFHATAPTAWADTIEQALAKAYQNNPQLNSQRAVVRATDESVPQALSGYRPTVTASASSGHELTANLVRVAPSGIPNYTNMEAGYAPTTLGATASQTLFNGFQTANRTRLAETNTSAARETLRVAEETVLLNAATAYMDLLRDNALLDVQQNNVLVLQELLRQTSARYMRGELSRTDVALAEANLSQTRGAVLSAKAQVAKSRATYREVIGVEATNLTPGAPVDRLSPRSLAEAIKLGRDHHPNVGVAMFGIDAAVLQVKINEGSLYPNVTLTGSVSKSWSPPPYQAVPTDLLQRFDAFVIGQVRAPLYQGGAEYALIRQSEETVGQKRIDLDSARDAVQRSISTVWGQLDASKAQVLAAQSQMAAAEIAYDGVRDEARNGLRTSFDVLYAIATLITARSTLLVAQHDRVVASYALLAAVGQLNLPKLGIDIPLYDPMVHYQQVRDAWVGVRTPEGH
jgi:outer membrane protein